MFGYVEGGYEVVLDRLRATVQARGVEIRCSRPATAVRGDARGAEIETSRTATLEKAERNGGDRTAERFDAVVLTVPCGHVATLCPQLTATERERLLKINYQGVICPSLLLRRPLAGLLRHEHHRLLGALYGRDRDDGARRSRSTFGGHALVYLPRYLSQSDPTWQRTDSSLLSESIEALGRMYPHFRADDVIASRVARARDVQAISTLELFQRPACRRSRPRSITCLWSTPRRSPTARST